MCSTKAFRWLSGNESCQRRRCGFDPGSRKSPWREESGPSVLSEKSHEQRSLTTAVHGALDTTERLSAHTFRALQSYQFGLLRDVIVLYSKAHLGNLILEVF